MASSWSQVQISDLGRVVTGRTPPGNDPAFYEGDVAFLTPSDMVGHRRIERTTRSLSPYGAKQLARCLVPHGVGVSCIGWQMGKAVLIDRPTVTNQQINSVVVAESVADSSFVYYSLVARRDELFNLGAGGSRTPILNKGDFERLPFLLPSLAEQRAIAHILGTLDEKIELNRQINETLEAMARAFFKSWFVDFDPVRATAEGRDPGLPKDLAALFPNSFEDSELGEIPQGWTVKSFADTVEVMGGGTPKTSVGEYWDGDIPWFSVVDAPGGADVWVVDTAKKISREGVNSSSTRILPVGTTIISARGTVGKIALVGVPMAMNQSCYGVRGQSGSHGSFTYFVTRELISSLQRHAHGSVFDTITRETLAGVSVTLPSPSVIENFETRIGPALEHIRVNLIESRTLAALRDTLLPKLISGEIRVNDAEQLVSSP